jgi:hypothetical protein
VDRVLVVAIAGLAQDLSDPLGVVSDPLDVL